MKKMLIALLAGFTVGVLIAPAKGAVTRRKLVNRFNDLTEDLADDAHDMYGSGKNLLDTVKKDVNDLAQEVVEITQPVKDLVHKNA